MKLHLIRNATLRLTYAEHTILIDPYFAPKHTLPSFTGRSPNPLVDLPISPQAAVDGIEMVIVSHLHTDHFDATAQDLLPKEMPIYCQPGDEASIAENGFLQLTPVETDVVWHKITIRRTPGRHGASEAVLRMMGSVSGFVFEAEGEPSVFWAGDTVWYHEVEQTLIQYRPDIIITHSGGAVWGDNEPIIMDAAQTIEVCRYVPQSIVIATHMESLDHCLTLRSDLRAFARQNGITAEQLHIPADGEVLEFKEEVKND